MKLHKDTKLFKKIIKATSERFKINEIFIEKDYWTSLILNRLSSSRFYNQTVFKGGTSLSKGYNLINRFSEDIDLALINVLGKSGNEIKTIIRNLEKEITKELTEINRKGITSKGSKFRKSVFEYESSIPRNRNNTLIIEINSFSLIPSVNECLIASFICNFLKEANNDYIEKYNLQPFRIKILPKKHTLIEKLVSLIRFSFDENPIQSLEKKIRHFYDLHFLIQDKECRILIGSENFKNDFYQLLESDKKIFEEPKDWAHKKLTESPLVNDFKSLWKNLSSRYNSELSALAYTEIPDEKEVAKSFQELLNRIL